MSERTPETELHEAVSAGDVAAARSLLDAGADVRYVRPRGYTVLIDAMYGRDIAADDQLLPLLRLLIDRGADLDAASAYCESALGVTSRVGRFDAVDLLLAAGADPAPLGWSPLHRAVSLGTVEDIRSQLAAGADLAARDGCERTPWLLSLHMGDLAKAEALLAAGANLADRGRCGKTALMYPVENGHAAVVRWLLARGADPNAADDYGGTALIEAAGRGDAVCVRLLLDAGADVHCGREFNSPITAAATVEVARVLVAAGANINEVSGEVRAALTRQPRDGSIACTAAEYHAARCRVFGTANPERMNFPFWKAMVAGGAGAYRARAKFEGGRVDDGAVWCFDRFGTSLTQLPDGRVIEIAGEHEDFYDPDFCIYNDVIVHHGDGTFDIYGYPAAVFPPTDFHTATLAGNAIYVIGSVGYQGERRYGTTPVFRLDMTTLAIEPVATGGESPGWISGHRARLVGSGIEVTGGRVGTADGRESYEANPDTFVLDLPTRTWSKAGRG